MRKICHNIESVFKCSCVENQIYIDLSTNGVLLDVIGHKTETSWEQAYQVISNTQYGGWLFISYCGQFFYAESEGMKDKKIYSS